MIFGKLNSYNLSIFRVPYLSQLRLRRLPLVRPYICLLIDPLGTKGNFIEESCIIFWLLPAIENVFILLISA